MISVRYLSFSKVEHTLAPLKSARYLIGDRRLIAFLQISWVSEGPSAGPRSPSFAKLF